MDKEIDAFVLNSSHGAEGEPLSAALLHSGNTSETPRSSQNLTSSEAELVDLSELGSKIEEIVVAEDQLINL